MSGIDRQVAILGVASVADRNRLDSTSDDPIDEDRHQQNGSEPDPPERPADEQRRAQGECEQEASQALIEVLLEEERAVPAERAPLDRPRRGDSFESRRVRRAAPLAAELARIGRGVNLRGEAARAVTAGAQPGYAGKPVATVR